MTGSLHDVVANGAEHSTLSSAVNLAASRLGLRVVPDPTPEQVVFVRSDQYSFVRHGVPSVFIVGFPAEADRPARAEWLLHRYHSPQDDLSQPLDFESLARFARLHYLVAWVVANQPTPPQWNPGDFFGARYGKR